MMDTLFLPIIQLADLYRKKELSPVEVLDLVFDRAAQWEPDLNAFITLLKEESYERAKKAEQIFYTGESTDLLTGVPFSVKDLFYTRNVLTSCGSRILKDFKPNYTATVVTMMEQNGAVLFGKTNMLEFAYGIVHPDYGQCNNPWDVGKTSGGSSSGSAASIAAGIGFASLGTDTGGSIRIPASYCGVVGLKPTYGLVSNHGVFPLSWSLDHSGPITRSVEDLAIVLDVIAGYDPLDRHSSEKADRNGMYYASLKRDYAGLRVGILPSHLTRGLDDEVASVFSNTLNLLLGMGMEVVEVDIPGFIEIEQTLMNVLLPEASHIHREWLSRKHDYTALTYQQIDQGLSISALDYIRALEERYSFRKKVDEIFTQVDILLTPTVAFPAPAEDPVIGDEELNEMTFTGPFNVSGHPAITMNGGFTQEGLPVGIQLVGKHFGEAGLLSVAHGVEIQLNETKRPLK
jgi:aspartyl-tRNA(Asn)/glutamyl-tRNA(Gln) amidotransferase subunit A